MKRSLQFLLHIGFWLGYFLLMAFFLFAMSQGQGEDFDPTDDVGYYLSFIIGIGILPPILSFYLHYRYLFHRFLQQRKIFLSIIGSIIISLLSSFGGFLFIRLTSLEATACIETGFPYAFTFTFGISTVTGIIALVSKGFFTWYEELKLKEELLKRTHSMELELVKSQLDPHFLFNSLNNIDVLITKDPEEASEYLKKLSDILRFMLYQTKDEEIPLCEELEYIEQYIELQKIRTANTNYVNYQVSGSPEQKKVAPMVFIPFIENAFKHATNKKVDHAVDIDIQIDDHAINFQCQNKFQPHKSETNGYHGLGNELIQRRLNLLYPEKHTLEVDRQHDTYRVALTILNGAV